MKQSNILLKLPIVLRNTLHKFILALGFTALIVVMTGANIKKELHATSLSTDMFNLPKTTPPSLQVDQCKDDKWLENGFIVPSINLNKTCFNIRERKNEHRNGLAFLRKQ